MKNTNTNTIDYDYQQLNIMKINARELQQKFCDTHCQLTCNCNECVYNVFKINMK